MVWDNWNPWKDIADEWGSSRNILGKLKLFLFYSYVWFGFFCSVGQIFMPVAMMDCLVANSSEQKDEIAFVSRQYGLYGAAWLLYVAKGKAHLPNMCVLVTVIVLSCTLSYLGEGKTIVHNGGECSSTWMGQGMWSIGWPVLAMILAYVERHTTDDRHKAPDAAENQTLV